MDELKRLAERRAYARLVYEQYAATNVSCDIDAWIELDVAYRRAQDEWMQAETDYRAAVESVARGQRKQLMEGDDA